MSGTDDASSSDDRMSAEEWILSDKQPELLPTPWLDPYEFEAFTRRLLRAQRFLGPDVRRVVRVAQYGVPGDKQDGIDLRGDFSDGAHAAWQCRHLERLRIADVRTAVAEVTYQGADECYLVFAGIATRQAQDEMDNHRGWQLLDRRELTDMLRELPAQQQREIIENTWGDRVRRLFLEAPGDGFVSIDTFAEMRRNPDAVMNDLGPVIGREGEFAALNAAVDRTGDAARQIVVVSGPAGRGKSRLVTEALLSLQEARPNVPVVCLSPGRPLQPDDLAELRLGPMLVFVDDAHADPSALGPLLALVRSRDDVQLVLATRPSATLDVLGQVINAGFGPSEIAQIDVGLLTEKEARQLVTGLTDGWKVPLGLKTYLATQAQHSPFVAVITMNMMKRGELQGPLAADEGLRMQVVSRYTKHLGATAHGFDQKVTNCVLATYTALGPTSSGDRALTEQIARFCGLEVFDLVKLKGALLDSGVMVDHGGVVRVVPDVLADSILESVAAYGEHDSGFVVQLWTEFSADHHHRLALALGELDWRLAQRGGPKVMAAIWAALRARLDVASSSAVKEELSHMEELAATQPAEMVAFLEDLRVRLDQADVDGTPEVQEPDEKPLRRLWGLRPVSRADVRAKLPALYARAAVNDPDQLETVLDALWALRRANASPTNSNEDHPARLVADHIANLAKLPDSSFPGRVVSKVAEWLEEPAHPDDVTSPLFALKPLFAKEGLETVQFDLRKLEFQPHLFDATTVREVRDQMRELLRTQALSGDLRRAGDALDLLGEALHQPHGYFGQEITDDEILQWEDDDLATVGTLEQIAASTNEPAVRRRVREVVEWSAEHASSLRLRHRALTLLAHLDSAAELADDLADIVWNHRFGLTNDRVRVVPAIEEMEAEREAEKQRTAGMSAEELQADRSAAIHDKVQRKMALVDGQRTEVTTRLLANGNVDDVYDLVDRTARAVQALRGKDRISSWSLWRSVAELAPEHLGALVTRISSSEPGPLDYQLFQLIGDWVEHDRADATDWLQAAAVDGRREIRLTIADGFANGWHRFGPPFDDLWASGTNDSDPDIAQAFLAGAGTYLREQAQAAITVLVEHDVTSFSATRALEDACSYDGESFGAALTAEDATAVLRLVECAGYDSYAVQEIVSGIATLHPRLVLDHLATAADRADLGRAPSDVHDLAAAFDEHAEVLAEWVLEHLDVPSAGAVLSSATNNHLNVSHANALASVVKDLDPEQLEAFVRVLGAAGTWATTRPELAHEVVVHAKRLSVFEIVRRNIQSAMQPTSWTGMNGVSSELNAALTRAKEAAENATDPDLQHDYRNTAELLAARVDEEKLDHDDDYGDDIGWS